MESRYENENEYIKHFNWTMEKEEIKNGYTLEHVELVKKKIRFVLPQPERHLFFFKFNILYNSTSILLRNFLIMFSMNYYCMKR